MKKVLIIVALTLALHEVVAQISIPIFVNKRDSAEFFLVQAAIMEIISRPQQVDAYSDSKVKLDSLFLLRARFGDKIIGYRIVPDKKFTSYEDLRVGTIKPELVTKLSFADNRLKSLPKEVFLCKNLSELELVNTSIKKLPSKLNTLEKLQRIYVYNNSISSKLRLGKNAKVKVLVIRGVKSVNLPRTYKNFKMLDTLDLSRNIGLSTFPNIYKNKTLSKLNLLENNLTLDDLKNISNNSLEELNLIKNKIKVVPDAIGSFSALKKLAFNYNEISEVKPGIGNLKKLESLSFYQNRLTIIPAGVFEISGLRVIDLYYNQIKTVDPEISKLKNLRVLFLAHNKLTSLPENLGDLTNLRELYLHNNRISYLPESLRKVEHLRVLRINTNQFTLFPSAVLVLRELENLDFSQNFLHQFPTELAGFINLQILALNDNPWENAADVERTAEGLRSLGTIVQSK